MQLFEVGSEEDLSVQKEVAPALFKDWSVGGKPGQEAHIEGLIVRYPGLLNFGSFDPAISSNDELLIVSRQPISSNRKRADLLAVHRDGSLVVVEIKRDAQDAKARSESMEFQALRYAAASRKLTASDVVSLFKNYLKKYEGGNDTEQKGDASWRAEAVKRLGVHLAEEDEEITEGDLGSFINPRTKQKIYLVAAGYEGDATAACAWLREHKIDISAFLLRPYVIAGKPILERERLIPPPELDEFMGDTFASNEQGSGGGKPPGTAKAPSDKPVQLKWSDYDAPVSVVTWRALFEHVTKRALSEGMPPEQLPMKWSHDDDAGMLSPLWIAYPNPASNGQGSEGADGVYVDQHGSSLSIRGAVGKILDSWGKDVTLTVTTQSGAEYAFPDPA